MNKYKNVNSYGVFQNKVSGGCHRKIVAINSGNAVLNNTQPIDYALESLKIQVSYVLGTEGFTEDSPIFNLLHASILQKIFREIWEKEFYKSNIPVIRKRNEVNKQLTNEGKEFSKLALIREPSEIERVVHRKYDEQTRKVEEAKKQLGKPMTLTEKDTVDCITKALLESNSIHLFVPDRQRLGG